MLYPFNLLAHIFIMNKKLIYLLLAIITLIVLFNLPEDHVSNEVHVAVTSSFSGVIKEISDLFGQKSGKKITLTFGSTGKIYAQILHGAPYHIFLAADKERPELLEKTKLIIAGSRFTYALGRLVLWSADAGYIDSAGEVLKQRDFKYIAIANPKLAPYGRAAEEVLRKLGSWDKLNTKIAYGENIVSTFHFIQSRNVPLGFITYAQLLSLKPPDQGSFWLIPQDLYAPIEQQAVLLRENTDARVFLEFLQSKEAQKIITDSGYIVP